MIYDVIIIGAGTAGMTAAVFLGNARRKLPHDYSNLGGGTLRQTV